MDINFLITCHENEQNIPMLVQLLAQYKKIKPSIVVAYSGEEEIPCDVRIAVGSMKPQYQEIGLIVEGYKAFKRYGNANKRIVKLSANVWPTDENKLIEIFEKLDELKTPYAGSYWHHNSSGSLSADFFVADMSYGDFLLNLSEVTNDSEVTLFQQIVKRMKKKPYLLPERDAIFYKHKYECRPLGLVMYDIPRKNLSVMHDWGIE